ncbi:GAF domain-containing protein [Streptomyces sp. NPDC048696]|uniref:GAF domain-containing protein n=1 Tax=Streptomyces sp. NPDC048696 TaxID=3365585 RepID=UPI0037198BD3
MEADGTPRPEELPDPPRAGPAPEQEARRIEAVRRYDIPDTPPDGAFDRIAALAARLFDTPVATVTIIDADPVWFKAAYGLEGVTQTGRDPGLCTSAILTDEPLVIPDTLHDAAARANALVTGPMRVRFYAAAPITTHDGHRLGTVDVLDTRSRRIAPEQTAALTDLAALVMDQLELRLSALRMLRVERELVDVEHAARERAERDRAEIASYAALLSHPTADSRFCTLAPDPAHGFTITMTGGGHPSVFHLQPVRRDGPARAARVDLTGGMLIGVLPDVSIASRSSHGARFDETGLAAHLTHHAAANTALGAAAIIDDLTSLLATFPVGPADDVALLSLGAAPTTPGRTPAAASGTTRASTPLEEEGT